MHTKTDSTIRLMARILMTAAIVRYGIAKFFDPALFIDNNATIGFMAFFANGARAPEWLAYVNAVFQTTAGLCVMVGWKARSASFLLVLWLSTLTYFGHPFWTATADERATCESYFLRNLAMIGALLMIVATGPGEFALDARKKGEDKAS
jgi:putative oxidoreductase